MVQHTWGNRFRIYHLDREDYLEIHQRCRECGARRLVYAGEWEKAPANNAPVADVVIDEEVIGSAALRPVVYLN